MCHVDPLVVVISVILAVVISFVALPLVLLARKDSQTRGPREFAGAIVMGAAMPTLPYTRMSAATFTIPNAAPDLPHVSGSVQGVVAIAAVTVIGLGIAILTWARDCRVPKPHASIRNSPVSVRMRVLRAALTTFCIMFVFEVTKQTLRPKITIWTSHALTILFTTLISAVLSFIVLRREENFRFILDDERKMLRALIDNIPDFIYVKDKQSRFMIANAHTAQAMGVNSVEELFGKTDFDFFPTELATAYYADEQEAMRSEQPLVNREEPVVDHKGNRIYILTTKVPLRDANGMISGIAGIGRDITERKWAEERIQFLAYYDSLTGLPNRTLLYDRLGKALASARRRSEKVALLFLDLDQFKTINDSLGHSFGDLLLQQVGERLRILAREQDTVARIGGDEFIIMLTALKDIPDAAVAAERVMGIMTKTFVVQGRRFSITCSIGIAVYPDHGEDAEMLVRNADAAMYSVKDGGRNAFRFFTDEMNAQVVERLTIEHNLRSALEKSEFFLVYQQQTDLATEKTTGMEALIRWQHPELGLVLPHRFIRIAENTGTILQMGEWVLQTACSAAREWQDSGLQGVSIAVNVSAVQFRQRDFCDIVRKVLKETRLAPQYLELELTESLFLSNKDQTFPVLQQLKAMGVKLAIDDFGTGYSNLSYLRQFPVHRLKIDRSFIQNVAVNADDAAITAAIITMGKSLSLRVIAEGVENEAQMAFLRAHHCDEVQGYYYSKPLRIDEIVNGLRHGPVRTLSAHQG